VLGVVLGTTNSTVAEWIWDVFENYRETNAAPGAICTFTADAIPGVERLLYGAACC